MNVEVAPLVQVPLELIRPNPAQPRQRFDEARLAELAASLREHGVLQPVLVRPLGDGSYELIAGERRWQAARRAGYQSLPALVTPVSPRRALELALVENVQRADLSPLEEAEAYRNLMATLDLTHERLAERLGLSRVAVTNRLRLLALAPAVREALGDGRISEGHARCMLALPAARQDEALALVLAGGLTVRQTERLVRRLLGRAAAPRPAHADYAAEALAERLRRALGARVRVRRAGAGMTVLLHFHSAEAALALAEAVAPDEDEDEL